VSLEYGFDGLDELLKDDGVSEQEQDLLWLATTERGQRFLLRLFQDAKLFGNIFTGNSSTFFAAGMRELGLKYFNELRRIHGVPDEFLGQVFRLEEEK